MMGCHELERKGESDDHPSIAGSDLVRLASRTPFAHIPFASSLVRLTSEDRGMRGEERRPIRLIGTFYLYYILVDSTYKDLRK